MEKLWTQPAGPLDSGALVLWDVPSGTLEVWFDAPEHWSTGALESGVWSTGIWSSGTLESGALEHWNLELWNTGALSALATL
jgi:hypothetical protein